METRKVTIINGKTQSQKVIQDSRATTLGELKAEMRQAGIDYEGMTFFEGHMRAELKDDAAPLPTNIPYKGQVVNDLVFMLTKPDKKVRSGAMSRADAYQAVKDLGLQDEIKRRFGKNFTQCGTADLEAVVIEASNASKPKAPASAPIAPEAPVNDCGGQPEPCGAQPEVSNTAKAVEALVDDLYDNGVIDEETHDKVIAILYGKKIAQTEKMSKKEVDDMFDFIH